MIETTHAVSAEELDVEEDVCAQLDEKQESIEEETFEVPEAFSVKDDGSANWVVRKIVEAQARAARMKQLKKGMDIEMKGAVKEEQFFFERFRFELEAFTRQLLSGSRKKSVKLLEGTVGFRKRAEQFYVRDQEAAIAWAKVNCPDAVESTFVMVDTVDIDWIRLHCPEAITSAPNVTEVINVARLDLHFRTMGDLPDGCVFEPEVEQFYVK